MLNTILNNVNLSNILMTLLVAGLGYIGKVSVKLVPQVIELLISKVGLTNYTKMKAIGLDIFNKIEEDGRLGKLVDSKVITFETLIKKAIPSITDADIELVRQSIAGEFNKDKPVIEKAVEEVTVTPITTVKYINAEGVELVPVVATVV